MLELAFSAAFLNLNLNLNHNHNYSEFVGLPAVRPVPS